jgi:hypothetical protein
MKSPPTPLTTPLKSGLIPSVMYTNCPIARKKASKRAQAIRVTKTTSHVSLTGFIPTTS